MAYLIITILLTVLLSFIFKWLSIYKVHRLKAIIINYLTCGFIGFLFSPSADLAQLFQQPWFLYAFLLAFIFILGFNILAASIAIHGVSITTLMQKMSIVLSASLSLIIYQESMGWQKLSGILIGITAVILSGGRSILQSKKLNDPKYLFLLPLLVLLVSAFVELGLQYAEITYLEGDDRHLFNTSLFTSAGILGIIFLIYQYSKSSSSLHFRKKDVIGGIFLGVPNYFSIYFLIMSISTGLEGSFVFPVINISVLLLSILGSLVIFGERLERPQLFGLLLAVISIALISSSLNHG